ncbi:MULTISPECIES: adenylosuccinate lyase [unclassified Arcicella]|uniref:adenylosuccinate lyase n=1 Tax=unclassified Arcicella TaxID=2644986 RepID=UPI00285C0461|nr:MULTISPECIES: adenylosuccinate lyase [unclassified Arcicella]MDR6563593.1 adenylosuccinate lyase [Arcicella sp. BE51]MDR6814269.1 adenylosuccinate lyase [Arcicella sp. BE140]MDR6825492.1 adenylosuccinate lyase [Arcicella sp. BE139]
MQLNQLTAISPIDGRYRKQVESLAPFFSEFGLIKYRVRIEIEYFIALCEIPLPQLESINKDLFSALRDIYLNFSEEDALWIKETEKVTNHDVKAVEYFIKHKLDKFGINEYLEFIHFGLTSQDVNNTAIPLSLLEAMNEVLVPKLEEVIAKIEALAEEWKNVPLLAHTHGQPASPTRLGKEFMVFVERMERQMDLLKTIPYSAKFGGATGNFNAHNVAYPENNWIAFGNSFVSSLGLVRSKYTTQIEHYDNLAALMDNLKRLNNIVLDLDRDVWTYVSMGYFKQKIKAGEVGSSAMPHKVNPIDFENSEGNVGIANALYEFLAAKLPVSRLQRDLTDSTVLRNLGVPIGHQLIALTALLRGLNKLELNQEAINADLEDNWAVVAEAIQTILRRESYPQPYEALKALTRKNDKITEKTISEFIDSLEISDKVKYELRRITPFNYVGVLE